MACCIGLMLLASCKKDAPTITVATGLDYVAPNTEVYSGNPIVVGFNVTGENLIQIMLTAEQNGVALFTHPEPLANVSSYSFTKTIILDATGTVTIRGTVTDALGRTATKSFDLHFNEKPNAKFLGHYDGDILVTGTIHYNSETIDLNNEPFATVMNITAGSGANDVVAAITIGTQTSTVNGTVEGNRVVFEAVNSTYSYPFNYQGINVPIPISMTYSINGTLNGNQLSLDGTCSGNGGVLTYTFDLEGTIGGVLNKTV